MTAPPPGLAAEGDDLTFGPYRISRMERLLLCDGKPVQVGGRAFDLLTVLAERAGAVVTHGELLELVWPKTIVEETSLRFHISSLRKLLGNGQEGIRYIATVSGRGYSFVAPVHVERPSNGAPPRYPVAEPGGKVPSFAMRELPSRLTPVVGRKTDIAVICSLLQQHRLVTLSGSGGVGKSVIAIEVARELETRYVDGVCLVDLSKVAEPTHLPLALATATGIGETPDVSTSEFLAAACSQLSGAHMLLVFDTCEHLIEAVAALVDRILKSAPEISVLATSREALACEGEWVHQLGPLDVAPADDNLNPGQALDFPAIQLFVERATANASDFTLSIGNLSDVVTLCRHLEGNPLAIELAAGRIASLGVQGQVSRLDDLHRLLARGRRSAQRRHSSLFECFEWSHELLEEPERVVLRRLSVLCGGFDVQAAVAVTTLASVGNPATLTLDECDVLDSLMRLRAKCLLEADASGGRACFRLPAVTRLLASEKLVASTEFRIANQVHAQHFLSLLDDLIVNGTRAQAQLAVDKHRVDVDAAIAWASSPSGDAALSASLLRAFDAVLANQLDREGARHVPDMPTSPSLQSQPRVSLNARRQLRLVAELDRG